MSFSSEKSPDGETEEETAEMRASKRRRLEQEALLAYFNSTGAWPENMPDEVVQNIVSYISFGERQKLRLVSQQFRHSIDSMRWPTLKLNFNR